MIAPASVRIARVSKYRCDRAKARLPSVRAAISQRPATTSSASGAAKMGSALTPSRADRHQPDLYSPPGFRLGGFSLSGLQSTVSTPQTSRPTPGTDLLRRDARPGAELRCPRSPGGNARFMQPLPCVAGPPPQTYGRRRLTRPACLYTPDSAERYSRRT